MGVLPKERWSIGPLKVHLGPMWVLEDWWPTIRDLTLCCEFCSEQHLKRQYERWNKILYRQQWRKREKLWRFHRIKDSIFYLSSRRSVLSRGIQWVSWWSAKHQNLPYLQKLLSGQSYPAPLLDSRDSEGTCPNPGKTCLAPLPYLSSRDLSRTCPASQPYPWWTKSIRLLDWVPEAFLGHARPPAQTDMSDLTRFLSD
jgi:hypothetical protein